LQEFPPTHFIDPAEVPLDEDEAPSCAIAAVARKSAATAEASNAPLVDLFMVFSIFRSAELQFLADDCPSYRSAAAGRIDGRQQVFALRVGKLHSRDAKKATIRRM
jgi:hypothetical protein